MLTDTVGQKFRKGPARVPCFYSTMPGPHLEDLKAEGDSTTGGWNHLRSSCGGWELMLAVGWNLSWGFWPA